VSTAEPGRVPRPWTPLRARPVRRGDDGPVDLSPALDELIDRYTISLREYAAFARGVQEEGTTDHVEDDPRVEELLLRLALLGAELDTAFMAETGVSAPVARVYEPDEEDGDDEADDVEELRVEFVVRGVDDDLLGWLAQTGESLAEDIERRGYEVLEWTSERAPVLSEDDDEAADAGGDDER